MSTVRPVKPEHSINEVAFVINFVQPFSEKNLQSLKQLEEHLKDELPKMEPQLGSVITLNKAGAIDEPLPLRLLSLSFKHFNDKGEFDWALRAEGNFIAVNCLDYSRWRKVWPKVINYFRLAADKLISPENPIDSLALQYVDRFIYEGQIEWYKTSTIFNDESQYLNTKVLSAGPFWHIHQGWFDSIKDLPIRVLNRLNITAAMADKEHHTTIDHSATVQFKKKITNQKTLFVESIKGQTAIDFYFDVLHKENKQVLRDLLNQDRINDIKLDAPG